MGVRGVHEALGIYTHDVHPPTQHPPTDRATDRRSLA